MNRLRAVRALHGIVLVVGSTMLLAGCDRSTPTYATFDIQPVTTPAAEAGPVVVATTAPPATTTTSSEASTTSTVPTTTTTFRVVTNSAPRVTVPATTTTTELPAPPSSVTTSTSVAARQGWITVLASLARANYTRAAAADWRVDLGIGDAELLLSDDYSSLTPGYWVLYRGPYVDRASAASVCSQYVDRVPGCYPAPLTLAAGP